MIRKKEFIKRINLKNISILASNAAIDYINYLYPFKRIDKDIKRFVTIISCGTVANLYELILDEKYPKHFKRMPRYIFTSIMVTKYISDHGISTMFTRQQRVIIGYMTSIILLYLSEQELC